ncbi:MAG: biopolymer transporter ExbD [Candidatus Auribacterota bacterium]|nr:biopolymer transporter ExbD [Candidatus Auribacterota bacterium]
MKFQRKTELKMGRLDIAPLMDVVLLLLIFFMLTSSFITPAGLRVDLPESTVAEPQDKENLVVVVSEEGELYIDDELVLWEDCRDKLAAGLTVSRDRILILKADRDTHHGVVVRLMSLARELGWKRMAIAAEPESQSTD